MKDKVIENETQTIKSLKEVRDRGERGGGEERERGGEERRERE